MKKPKPIPFILLWAVELAWCFWAFAASWALPSTFKDCDKGSGLSRSPYYGQAPKKLGRETDMFAPRDPCMISLVSWTRAQVLSWVIHRDWEVFGLTHWHPMLNSASTTDYPYIVPLARFYRHVNHGIRHCISKVPAVNSHHGLVTWSCAPAEAAPRRTTCSNAVHLLLWTWPNNILHLDFQLRSDLLAVLWNTTSFFLFSPYSWTCSIEYTPMAKFNKLSARNFNQIFNLSTM